MAQDIALNVNGRAVSVAAEDATPLLDVLRNQLDLKGTRYGCGLEQCGSCMVLLDGEPVYACSREIGTVAGRSVTTIEGIGSAARPHPLQQAFLDEQAGQCGYCLSGILMSAKALLDRNPAPTRADIVAALDKHLCRCGAHPRILRAVERAAAELRGGRRVMSDTLPLSIQNNRRMETWFRFDPDRTVRLAVGKVELGQGNVTALAQIAADELDVDLDRIAVLSGDTQDAPDEGQTTGSQSIEVSGRSVRLVSAELRARVLDRLARRLNCSPSELTVEDGAFRRGDTPTGHDYWNFASAEDFAGEIEGTATPKPHTAYRVVGKPVPRRDLPAKVAGAAFVHDMVRPDLLHARILRQPSRGARLASLDEAAVRRAGRGEFQIVRVGDFVAFVGADESVVQRAAVAAPMHAKWDNVRQIAPDQQEAAWLVGQASNDRVAGRRTPRERDAVRGVGELFAAVCRACLDGAVLRSGGIPQRASVGLVAHAGRLSAARRAGQCAWHRAGRDHRAPCARCRMLRPQRRR